MELKTCKCKGNSEDIRTANITAIVYRLVSIKILDTALRKYKLPQKRGPLHNATRVWGRGGGRKRNQRMGRGLN